MNLKTAVHCAVKRWNEKRTSDTPQVCRTEDVREAADSTTKQGENIRQTDNCLSRFIDESCSLRFNLLTDSTETKLGEEPDGAYRIVSVRDTNTLCLQAHAAGIPCWDRDVLRHVQSSQVAAYHPFRSYFEVLSPLGRHGTHRRPGAARVGRCGVGAQLPPVDVWRGCTMEWDGRRGHGLSVVPLLVNDRQGTGKSIFCQMLMPLEPRDYF